MDVNSAQGGKVITRVDFGNTEKTTPETVTTQHMSDLFKRDPEKYWWLEAKRAEINLNYEDAANKYTAAYTHALKEKHSSALHYKWEAMRCIEFAAIYKDLKMDWQKVGNKGKYINETSQMIHWHNERDLVPTELLAKYKPRLPVGFPYNLVIYDKGTKQCRFIHCVGFYADSEPTFDREYIFHPEGWMESRLIKQDPEVLFDKWMLLPDMPGKDMTHDRKVAIRRSIKLRYLNVPEPLNAAMKVSSVFKKYVAPAIGNRSVGALYGEYMMTRR